MPGTIAERMQGYEDEYRSLNANSLWLSTIASKEVGSSMIELEKFIVDAMPDNKLPLFINRQWLDYGNESYFKIRLANAQLEAENVHYS